MLPQMRNQFGQESQRMWKGLGATGQVSRQARSISIESASGCYESSPGPAHSHPFPDLAPCLAGQTVGDRPVLPGRWLRRLLNPLSIVYGDQPGCLQVHCN